MSLLRLGVLLAAAWTVLALAFLHMKAKSYGKRTLYSRQAQDPGPGIVYAFTKGMAPWAKESVMMNLPAYGAGMAFHAGVLTGLGLLLAAVLGRGLPGFLLWPARLLTLAGGAGGLGLLLKRSLQPQLRGMSCPDDYVSNDLSSLFALLAFAATFSAAAAGLWMAEGILLLVYAPLGKIRHCLFFFTTRYHLGAFFGRRGTFPPGGSFHA
jgi:predicted outer membrane lipoprotein